MKERTLSKKAPDVITFNLPTQTPKPLD